MISFLIFVGLGYVGYRGYKLGYFEKFIKQTEPTAPAQSFFPCTIEGSFSMPSHEARIAARNTSLINKGHVVTGDDSIDNAVLGGGSPDGGIWLSGSFKFEIDANGQQSDDSWIAVFSPDHNPVTGGVTGDGDIRMGSPAGLTITGKIVDGKVIGKVSETGMIARVGSTQNLDGNAVFRDGKEYLEYVHGVMSGTVTKK